MSTHPLVRFGCCCFFIGREEKYTLGTGWESISLTHITVLPKKIVVRNIILILLTIWHTKNELFEACAFVSFSCMVPCLLLDWLLFGIDIIICKRMDDTGTVQPMDLKQGRLLKNPTVAITRSSRLLTIPAHLASLPLLAYL